jgi:hypothetical protein
MRAFGWILFVVFAVPACEKPERGSAATPSASPAASTPTVATATAASPPTVLSADPPFGEITPSKKPPFEAARFRMRSETDDTGWPEFDAANLSNKAIVVLNIYGYAYDKDGKQVGRTKPLSWNEKLEPGRQTTIPIRVGRFEDKVSDAAVAFELCYTSIRFEGEKDSTRDDERCPDQKTKSN